MSGHTKGPWIATDVNATDDEPLAIWRDDGRSDFYLRTEHIAECFYDDGDGEGPNIVQAKANARLIAAAPDLLAALRELAEWIQSDNWDSLSEADLQTECDRIGALAHAAIAKATQP